MNTKGDNCSRVSADLAVFLNGISQDESFGKSSNAPGHDSLVYCSFVHNAFSNLGDF